VLVLLGVDERLIRGTMRTTLEFLGWVVFGYGLRALTKDLWELYRLLRM